MLLFGSLLPAIQNSSGLSKIYAASVPKSGVRLNKLLIEDLSLDYGAIKEKCGDKPDTEQLGHGEYYAEIPYSNNLGYYFDAFDPEFIYELKDTSPCIKVEGALNEIFSGLKKNSSKKISLKSFIKSLKKNNYNVKYKVLEGQPTSYYISEHYVEVTFKLKKSDKKTYCLNLDLGDGKNTKISLLNHTWLFIKN